jgi:peroxiredoxin
MIAVGDRLPDIGFKTMGPDGPKAVSAAELFDGRKVVLFCVPGAYTGTCTLRHLPGFMQHADAIRAKGVDQIACIAVNDVFVMDAWGRSVGVDARVTMLADGSGDWARATGLQLDLKAAGLGERIRRCALIVENRVVKYLALEEGAALEASSAESILKAL